MSGFERNSGGAWTTEHKDEAYPEDFSRDEAEFASELRELFCAEREELPPKYTQTLLGDERTTIPESGFEHKLVYRVFRRLSLPRRPLVDRNHFMLSWRDVVEPVLHVTRPVAAGFTALLMIMVFSVVVASPSFAAGLRILLGRTGVEQVATYPQHVRKWHDPGVGGESDNVYSLASAASLPLQWLGLASGSYVYQGARAEDAMVWSKGPIVDIQYQLTGSHIGTGLLDIREFQVNDAYSSVLAVVKAGSTAELKLPDGTNAVFIDGSWSGIRHFWQPGVRSELVYEENGVVFWIVGDQRDGMGQAELLRLAGLLVPASPRVLEQSDFGIRFVGHSLAVSFAQPVGTDVLKAVPAGQSADGGTGVFYEEWSPSAPGVAPS